MNKPMPLFSPPPEAVLFDYGNTLIAFDAASLRQVNGALETVLLERFGKVDRAALDVLRERDRMAPYQNGFRENHLPTICGNLVRELYGQEPDESLLAALLRSRYDSFLEVATVGPAVRPLLETLGRRFRLGLVSNYPDGRVLRESMRRGGIHDCFDSIVVSGDIGRVKPHPLPFETALRQMRIEPDRAVYIGDNWLADIQGPKRLGMRAIHLTQYQTPEHFERDADHHEADATLERLDDLPALLGL